MWWITQWPLGMVTTGFFLLFCGKLLLNQRQRKPHTSGCYICYIKAVTATSRVTSGPAKGLRWRSHLSGILFQLDRKPRQNSTRENLPYCSPLSFYHGLLPIPLDSPLKYHPTSRAFPLARWGAHRYSTRNAAGGTEAQTVVPTWWRLGRTRQFCCSRAVMAHGPTLYHFRWESNQNKCRGALSRREESTLCLQQTNNWSHRRPSASAAAGPQHSSGAHALLEAFSVYFLNKALRTF